MEWGSICCSSVRSLTLSHTQPFQESEQYIFLKELCRSSLLCRLHASAYEYTTPEPLQYEKYPLIAITPGFILTIYGSNWTI